MTLALQEVLQELCEQVARNQVGDETTPLTAHPGPGVGPELTDLEKVDGEAPYKGVCSLRAKGEEALAGCRGWGHLADTSLQWEVRRGGGGGFVTNPSSKQALHCHMLVSG